MTTQVQQFADALRAEIRRDMNTHCDAMAQGGCQDFAHYKHLCGVIQGLAQAEAYLLDLAKKVNEADDDDA